MTGLIEEASREQRELSSKQHFEVMDGLRGVAAMAVVLFHSFRDGGVFANGRLAVDFFFILSGFVIGYAYDEKLRAGMSFADFAARRLIRLYPMVLIGALGGICIALVHNVTNNADAYPISGVITSGSLSLFLLPYLGSAIPNKEIFSFNPPLWSLLFELAANFVYALAPRLFSKGVLAIVIVLGLIGVVLGGELGGGGKDSLFWGVPRVACGFFGGLLLYNFWRDGSLPRINGRFYVLALIISLIFAIPADIEGLSFVPVYFAFVGVVIAAVGAKPSARDPYCAFLGQVSYPLYLLHWLTMYVFVWIGTKLLLGSGNWAYTITVLAHFICVPFLAYMAERFYDYPVRKALMIWWSGGQPRTAAAAGESAAAATGPLGAADI